jgi:hypothetical protein
MKFLFNRIIITTITFWGVINATTVKDETIPVYYDTPSKYVKCI